MQPLTFCIKEYWFLSVAHKTRFLSPEERGELLSFLRIFFFALRLIPQLLSSNNNHCKIQRHNNHVTANTNTNSYNDNDDKLLFNTRFSLWCCMCRVDFHGLMFILQMSVHIEWNQLICKNYTRCDCFFISSMILWCICADRLLQLSFNQEAFVSWTME